MQQEETSSKPILRAFDTLRAVLTEIGWDPQLDEETAGFVVNFDPPYIPVAYAYAAISPELELFVFHINFGVAAAAHRRDEMVKFLALVNWNLMSGSFDMDCDDGQVRFRTSVCFEGIELSEALIRSAIRFAMNAVERYAGAAIDVMARGKSADQAYREAREPEGFRHA